MSLRKFFFGSPPEPAAPAVPAPVAPPQDNVVPISSGTGRDVQQSPTEDLAAGDAIRSLRVPGLLDAEEIVNFFGDKYFNWGQHNGNASGPAVALTHGRSSIIARFQNTLAVVAERKHALLHRVESQMLEVDGINPTLTQRLSLACDHLRRDISVLEKQSDLAADGKGWVLEALNQYQSGFVRGISLHCDLENLGV